MEGTKKPASHWTCGLKWLREEDLNLRPSGYEPDELPGCSIPRQKKSRSRTTESKGRGDDWDWAFWGPGGDLLSHVLRRSTIGAGAFHGRVREGIGCIKPRHSHQVTGTPGTLDHLTAT